MCAAACGFKCMATKTGTGIQKHCAGANRQSIKLNGKHGYLASLRRSFSTLCGMANTSRYWSTVSEAQCRQLQRSTTRCLPAAPIRLRSSALSRPRLIEAARPIASPGAQDKTVSLSAPVTSGNAPPVVATRQVPVAIASMAGRLKPSYKLGTTANSASAYNSTIRSSVTPDTCVMQSLSPNLVIKSAFAPSRGRPMMVR